MKVIIQFSEVTDDHVKFQHYNLRSSLSSCSLIYVEKSADIHVTTSLVISCIGWLRIPEFDKNQ